MGSTKPITLSSKVQQATFSRLVPTLAIIMFVGLGFAISIIHMGVSEEQDRKVQILAEQLKAVEEALREQVAQLASNDLIINSLIDYSNRDTYLPVFFRSLWPVGYTGSEEDFSIAFTDFEGELIAGSNRALFTEASTKFGWIETTLENANPYALLNTNGWLIAAPVIYGDSAEGAIFFYIRNLKDVVQEQIDATSVAVELDGTPLYIRTESTFEASALPDIQTVSTTKPYDAFELVITESVFAAYAGALGTLMAAVITLGFIFGGAVISTRIASNSASDVINRLKNQVTATSGDLSDFKPLEAEGDKEQESIEIEALRTSFNELISNLKTTTYFKDQVESVIYSIDEMIVVFTDDNHKLLSNTSFDQLCALYGKETDPKTIFPDGFIREIDGNNVKEVRHTPNDADAAIYVQWHKALYTDPTNGVQGFVLSGIDVTQTVRMQQELTLKNKAIDEALTPIIITDATIQGFPITYVNKAFELQTGYSFDEVFGRSCNFLQGDGSAKEDIEQISSHLRELKPVTTTIVNYRKDGSIFHNRLSLSPIKDQSNKVTHFLGFQNDITEQEKARALLEEAREKAEESAKLKSEFLASMSHEIRTPMNGVLGMLGLLESTTLDKEQNQHVRLAKSSAESLLVLINDILDFSKIEAGKLTLEHVEFDLVNLLSEVACSIACVAEDKTLEVVLDVTDIQHRKVTGDPSRIRQIINNLLGNGIKFTERGHVLIKASTEEKENNACAVHIAVHDTGVGIPAERIDKIFESFSQVDASTTRKFGGTGLGLTICKQLAALMHGDINVTSELGVGSVFSLDFDTAGTLSAVENEEAFSALRALIFDASKASASAMSKQISQWHVDNKVFDDSDEALNELKKNKTDLLVFATDMKINAKEFVQQARESSINPDLKVFMAAKMAELNDTNAISGLKLDGYFTKPVTVNDLHDTLHALTADEQDSEVKEEIAKHDNFESLRDDKRVLLVEDNPINQVLAVALLEGLGLQVDVANHGLEALDMLKTTSEYALVFMDCQMPEMDGYETTHNIRAGTCGDGYKNIPIIAMTANAIEGDKEKCLEAGMSDYISKPIDTAILQERVNHWFSALAAA